jgi:hypothetical protein
MQQVGRPGKTLAFCYDARAAMAFIVNSPTSAIAAM